jgi:uncharacterized phiE125 gp8 family phage protein
VKPKIIAQPVVEPLTIEECRAHLEAQPYGDTTVDDADDAMIAGLMAAAREHCANFLGMSLAPCTLEIALDKWPTAKDDGVNYVEMPMGPVREILSFTAGEMSSSSSSTDNEIDESSYVLDTYTEPARIVPVSGLFSVSGSATNYIKIMYAAGYGVDSDGGEPLPKAIRAAILLVLGHLYKHREENVEKALASLPLGAEALMRPLRVRLGMA